MTTYSAPAKIIIFGEHAVVYGQPAIAIPVSDLRAYAEVVTAPAGHGLRIRTEATRQDVSVDLRAQVDDALVEMAQRVLRHLDAAPPDVTIRLHSTIPIASGLGSGASVSAALARALAGALNRPLLTDDLNALVFEMEKRHHGTPSGIDNTVIVYEQPVYFVRGRPIERLRVGAPFHFVIADTGASSLTKPAVAAVRALYDADPRRIQSLLDRIGVLVASARAAIGQGDRHMTGRLMDENHAILRDLTVSSLDLDRLVGAARGAGALGAKMSGGGRGGNMIALVEPSSREGVHRALSDAGAARLWDVVLN